MLFLSIIILVLLGTMSGLTLGNRPGNKLGNMFKNSLNNIFSSRIGINKFTEDSDLGKD